jgi:hypothetical protein
MARLAANDLTADTNVSVYTVPAARRAVLSVSLCNRSTEYRRVRLALQNGALTDSDYIEYDALLPPNGVLERTNIVLTATQVLMARADGDDVSCVVWGLEEQG